jgi:hypothetical protein
VFVDRVGCFEKENLPPEFRTDEWWKKETYSLKNQDIIAVSFLKVEFSELSKSSSVI